jgi:hypothetical protein
VPLPFAPVVAWEPVVAAAADVADVVAVTVVPGPVVAALPVVADVVAPTLPVVADAPVVEDALSDPLVASSLSDGSVLELEQDRQSASAA